jgi:uncharacterized protein (DUF1330 family)
LIEANSEHAELCAAPAAIAAAGGRYLVRGGELAVFEGDWQPSRLVVLEFEDLAAAKQAFSNKAFRLDSRDHRLSFFS